MDGRMNMKSVSRSDILLAIIAAAGNRGFRRVYAQKVAFLVSEEFKGQLPDGFYEFGKYHYGPFSRTVYRDAEALDDLGCISIKYGEERRDDLYRVESDCELDDLRLPTELQQYIDETVDWVSDMSFAELLRAVYLLHPEYLENSRFAFDEEEALAESFERSLKQLRAGKTYSTEDILSELRSA